MRHRKEVGEKGEDGVGEKNNINGDGEETGEDQKDPIEDRQELIEDLFEKAEAYAKTNVELFKFKAADKLSVVIASLVSRLIIVVIFSFFFLLINVGLAIWLGESMGHIYYGFFIVSGLYALIAIVVFVFRNPVIKNPIINSIISQIIK